jgi:glycogen(starch) synthase
MSHDKGTMHLLEAMRRLRQSGRLVDLAFAGTILAPFQRYLATLPTKEWEWLHVLGPVSEEEKRDLLAAADVFAMPSRTDSFGIVYLEAWLYGKPVIGARTWGVSDVIADGHDGLLVPFGDVPALAKAIAELLDDPQRRSEMGKRGQRKVLQYHTWEVKYPHVRDLYRSLTGERESG